MIDIYDTNTWPRLRDMRTQMRDALFDLESSSNPDLDKITALEQSLRDIERRLQNGETFEVPW